MDLAGGSRGRPPHTMKPTNALAELLKETPLHPLNPKRQAQAVEWVMRHPAELAHQRILKLLAPHARPSLTLDHVQRIHALACAAWFQRRAENLALLLAASKAAQTAETTRLEREILKVVLERMLQAVAREEVDLRGLSNLSSIWFRLESMVLARQRLEIQRGELGGDSQPLTPEEQSLRVSDIFGRPIDWREVDEASPALPAASEPPPAGTSPEESAAE